ncbi:MAG: FecR domain-containing protein [Chitinophagaceae bacterium]|nr:FecR domain-containing protein [Chitinophagaceae bacterium]
MSRERFEYLLGLYKSGGLTQAEWDELREAIRQGVYDPLLEKDFRALLEEGGRHESWTTEAENAVWRGIQQGRRSGKSKVSNMRRLLVRGSAVAASIIVCFALTWRFLSHIHPNAKKVTAVANNDVAPGGNKAILTLGNGTQIILDGRQDGRIARQGSTSVLKFNGVISYSRDAGRMPAEGDAGTSLYNTITTPRGGQYELVLPDGSRVWLNSASSLRFPTAFKGTRREVELKGEGYFEIEKDAERPFAVSVNNMKVQVLGTSFNTMAYPDERTINTTLLDGAVIVAQGDMQKKLEPGQQAALDSIGHRLSVRRVDIRQAIAWKTGLFEFDNTDLATVMRQVARWYDIEVIYQANPDKTLLGGSISRSLNLKEVLSLLETNGINHFKIEGKKVFVLP